VSFGKKTVTKFWVQNLKEDILRRILFVKITHNAGFYLLENSASTTNTIFLKPDFGTKIIENRESNPSSYIARRYFIKKVLIFQEFRHF
jgi:hypothetical protein